ncbi:MAG: YraN family protein [Candidatus Pacebacteria bacterium]|nr:YraN family protein [Candidatus Paceibacterota bacterium]
MSSRETGNIGEKIAENFLKEKGYKILDKNYSFRIFGPQKGEIDIIAKKDGVISFVEVKTLAYRGQSSVSSVSGELSNPEIKVDFIKMQKIIKTGQSWLMKNKIPLDSPWRVDVVAVVIDEKTQKAKVRHLENAIY